MGYLTRIGLQVLAWLLLCGAALAQDVTLTSRDGNISIDGTLLGYDGEFYRVDTIYGALTLDGEGVVCTGPGCPDLAAFVSEIGLSGSRLMADVLMPALIRSFADRNSFSVVREVSDDTLSTFVLSDAERVRARFSLRGSTTREGFADLIAEEADIALAVRSPTEIELGMAIDSGVGDLSGSRRSRVIARDGLVIATAPIPPVPTLTFIQIADIFAGRVTNWSDLGGPDAKIALHIPSSTSGLTQTFQDRVMEGAALSAAAITHTSMEDLVDAVALDPFAIGVTVLSETGNSRPIKIAGACGFERSITAAALRTEDYPLTVPMMLYTPARRLPLLGREFIEFVTSSSANVVIRRAGFVDQAISTSELAEDGNRLAQAITQAGAEIELTDLQRLVEVLKNRTRLSTTFRFEGGATQLDVQSRENISRLAEALELGIYDGKDLLFVGFSDSDGAASANLRLSQRRARSVLAELRRRAEAADFSRIQVSSDAFGEAYPVACDDTEWGRAINRRVEVWVR